ncbi:hypothetical protein ACIG56_00245 [Nocardia fusca]
MADLKALPRLQNSTQLPQVFFHAEDFLPDDLTAGARSNGAWPGM